MTHLSNIGKYEVQALVGEGAMGVVYRALDPMLNRSVAVKVMNDALALDDSFRTRFLREARAAGSLQHPNVITVFDCGETDGHLYIAMEYVEGTDLEQVMAAKVPLALPEKLDIVIGVLNGLGYAHKRGIVHRDMKPANIRVSDEGRALIMDFGIAHTESSNVTRTGHVLGTPNYMAPEQVTGGDITPQTDIFAVGVVLYELLTDRKPFEGASLHSVLFKIVGEMPARPDTVVQDVRADLADVVMKALAKEPAERYESAADMANALTKVKASLASGTARPSSRTLSLRASIDTALHEQQAAEQRAAKRRLRQQAAIAAGAVLLLGGGGAYLLRGTDAPPPRTATPVVQQQAVTGPATSPLAAPPVAVPAATVQPKEPAPSTPAPAPAPDMSVAMSVRTAAQRARQRALDAGATTAQLASAEKRYAAGEAMIRAGQRDAAIRELTLAATAFGDAAGAARKAAAALAATASREPVKDAPKETVKAPAVIASAPVVAPPIAASPTPAPPPAGNPSAEIATVVAQYARAIESRDVGELRRLYPGMSPAQANAFDDFFKSVRSLNAGFSISSLQVDGGSAEAKLTGAYDFVTSSGRTQHQPVTLAAVLRREGATWRFVSIK